MAAAKEGAATAGRAGESARYRRTASGVSWLSSAAMAVVSDAWDYIIDEAAVAEAAPQLAASKPSIDIMATCHWAGKPAMLTLFDPAATSHSGAAWTQVETAL